MTKQLLNNIAKYVILLTAPCALHGSSVDAVQRVVSATLRDLDLPPIERVAEESGSEIVYRIMAYTPKRTVRVYTVLVFPHSELSLDQREHYYLFELSSKTVLIESVREGDRVAVRNLEVDRDFLLSFLSVVGETEVFALPPVHKKYEPMTAKPATGGGSYVVCERFSWGDVKRVLRNERPKRNPTEIVVQWLVSETKRMK